ncbi:unnamed protein product [Sphenostylis stenocarpa]|uniref:Uncharacterized protein n=1 Tax=Sphenostylis stenocarpa TaxID=92480 RepID=A0AA86RSW5_9FABA|nr:unnamed protein product [Sphenostylis stenocarpa]
MRNALKATHYALNKRAMFLGVFLLLRKGSTQLRKHSTEKKRDPSAGRRGTKHTSRISLGQSLLYIRDNSTEEVMARPSYIYIGVIATCQSVHMKHNGRQQEDDESCVPNNASLLREHRPAHLLGLH